MATTFDPTDVPCVEMADLAAGMRALIDAGRGLVLLNGATEADMDVACLAMQQRYRAEPQRALCAFVRFRHLIDVFSARRLQELMLGRGFALLAPAVAVAASLRLNAHRGFNPQQFLMALDAAPNNYAAAVQSGSPRGAWNPELSAA